MNDDLVVVREDPFNAETPLHRQVGIVTPNRLFFRRDHFSVPRAPGDLVVDGAVERSIALQVPDDLAALPSRSLVVTLECAGNGRAFLDPKVPGEPWRLGAVSTAEWTGTPLRAVLVRAGVRPSAVEVLCEGSDAGEVPDAGGRISFARSLPLEKALHEDTLLAYAMNGEPLPVEHGGPLRLVVPGWYGMASVKWLRRLAVLERPFEGFYQKDRYVIDGLPLRGIEVRAVIVSPREGARVRRAPLRVRGYAWSGHAPVVRVDVSVDRGETWGGARLLEAASPYAWRAWEVDWEPARGGEAVLLARATDAEGRRQSLEARWSPLGYSNNAAQPVRVTVD